MEGFGADGNRLGVQVDFNIASANNGIGVSFGAADDSLNTGEKFGFVKRFGEVIISAVAQAFNLFIRLGQAGQNENGGVDLGCAEVFKNFIAVHVRQHQVENNDVIII